MADNDQSLYNIRYNQVTQGMEGFGGGSPLWTPLILTADGGITQLHGDATAGPGTGDQTLTLATVNTNVGSFTSANITVDEKGRITAASSGTSGGGLLLQYVSFNDLMEFATTSTSFVATNTTVSITPTSLTSNIFISVTGQAARPTSGEIYATIYRDGVNIGPVLGFGRLGGNLTGTGGELNGTIAMSCLDIPGTTSPVTYTVYIYVDSGEVVFWPPNDGISASVITVFELAA